MRELRASLREPARRSGLCAVEGWRLLSAAVGAGVRFDVLVLTEAAAADPAVGAARAAARAQAGREVIVSADVFAALTQVPSPQGVLAVARRPATASLGSAGRPQSLTVVLDGIQDPGNVGTIVRTAVACGATLVVLCGATADPFGPKALRASAGAAFDVPIADGGSPAAVAEALSAASVHTVVADAHGASSAGAVAWDRPLALVFGNEGAGAAPVWRDHGAAAVRVPTIGRVESLNVAAAAAMLLYHAAGLVASR